MNGISLESLPDTDEWLIEIAPSFGIVTVILPDVLSAFSEEGTVELTTDILPEIVSASTLSKLPEALTRPDVVSTLRVELCNALSSVTLPDTLSALALSKEPDTSTLPDVVSQ